MEPILWMLRSKVIPWTHSSEKRLVVARSNMREAELPFGTSLSSRPLTGKRTILRRRKHANQRAFAAFWPQSNQQEMVLPKLACVVSGKADYLLGDYCLHANEGTFIMIPAHMPHHRNGPFLDAENRATGSCTMLFAYAYKYGILFWFSESFDGNHVNDLSNSYLIRDANAIRMLQLAMEESCSEKPQSEAICKSLLSAFFISMERAIKSGDFKSVLSQEGADIGARQGKDFQAQVEEYIRSNLHKRPKVKDAAAHMFMSSSLFSRTIRQKTDHTFVELLTQCRVERATELLCDTDWTVEYITQYVGFKSTAYFHEFFKQQMGCSPMNYRRQQKK